MAKNSGARTLQANRRIVTEKELKEKITSKLTSRGIPDPNRATDEQLYYATVQAIKDVMIAEREKFKKRIKSQHAKKVYYLCMEFLVGRSLKSASTNLGIYKSLSKILEDFGSSFDKIYSYEKDPGLGNGGLGRLAACFMESLSACDFAANGHSLLYETGLFKQKIVEGEQIELPDEWLDNGGVWLVPHPELTVNVRFGGKIDEKWENGVLKISNYEYDEVKAVPYDLLIPGTETNAVNKIRLWKSKQAFSGIDHSTDSQSSYLRTLSETSNAEIITRQLYPKDDYDEGKLLRLSQQYFLVSASLQSIINDYLSENGSLENFENKIAIHINDTHPALCIPELMRILMDVYSYSWDNAWEVVIKCISYTNHTVLPEALETWRVDLFSIKLPRIFNIITEINRRFTADLWNLYPGDWDRISRMSVIAYNQVRMANLSVVGSHSVNGVSKLHSDILKKTVFHDFYKMTPWKFTNVTNGVTHRRWLLSANSELTALLDELIGTEYKTETTKLEELIKYKDDTAVLDKIRATKQKNKENFAKYIFEKTGETVDPTSIFDVQIKRMHEYKRQLLNVMKIIALYNELLENPSANIAPQTFIFGCKAAPGYAIAKRFIKLIYFLSKELSENPLTKDKIKVVFLEEYNVSLAELLIPSADISEQISLAGKEASGTGCMKLMMNGAITIGTLDGANVEIAEAVGRDNIYIFGLNATEVEELWRNGYSSLRFYHSSERIKAVVDRFYSPIGNQSFSYIADYLINTNHGIADPFMCLADFDSYFNTAKRAVEDYQNTREWSKKSLINIAESGIFSSDVSVKHYAEEIWGIRPIRDLPVKNNE